MAQKRLRSLDVDLSALRGVVASNAKQRFELLLLGPADTDAIGEGAREDDPANYLIRATQGHSIKGLDAEALLTPVLVGDSDFPNEVVHGTYPAAWKAILESGGLKRMGRMHIHFATGVSDDDAVKGNDKGDRAVEGGREGEVGVVVSGMRASAGILVWVDVRRSIEGGDVRWWRSRNGVILTEGSTEGEGKGLLGLEYVSHVVDRRNGNVIWKNEWWEEGSGA